MKPIFNIFSELHRINEFLMKTEKKNCSNADEADFQRFLNFVEEGLLNGNN